jgi:hypothetical protein
MFLNLKKNQNKIEDCCQQWGHSVYPGLSREVYDSTQLENQLDQDQG